MKIDSNVHDLYISILICVVRNREDYVSERKSDAQLLNTMAQRHLQLKINEVL